MRILNFRIIRSLMLFVSMTSCSTYYLSTESLRNQFSGIDSTKLRDVTVRGPAGERYNYLANPIGIIDCTDKNGNPNQLINSPSIEIRVTKKDGKRIIFYFDRVLVTDSVLHGVQSRFISSIDKTIELKEILQIEIQDGRKNFSYVKE